MVKALNPTKIPYGFTKKFTWLIFDGKSIHGHGLTLMPLWIDFFVLCVHTGGARFMDQSMYLYIMRMREWDRLSHKSCRVFLNMIIYICQKLNALYSKSSSSVLNRQFSLIGSKYWWVHEEILISWRFFLYIVLYRYILFVQTFRTKFQYMPHKSYIRLIKFTHNESFSKFIWK